MSELDGIYEHLNELRTRVLRVVIVIGIIAVFLMTFHLESISYNEVILYYPIPEPLDNIRCHNREDQNLHQLFLHQQM